MMCEEGSGQNIGVESAAGEVGKARREGSEGAGRAEEVFGSIRSQRSGKAESSTEREAGSGNGAGQGACRCRRDFLALELFLNLLVVSGH